VEFFAPPFEVVAPPQAERIMTRTTRNDVTNIPVLVFVLKKVDKELDTGNLLVLDVLYGN